MILFLTLLFRRLLFLIFSLTLFSISNLINFDDNIFLNVIISLFLPRQIQLTGVGHTAYRGQWLYVPFILPMMRAVTSLMISLVIMTFLKHDFFSNFSMNIATPQLRCSCRLRQIFYSNLVIFNFLTILKIRPPCGRGVPITNSNKKQKDQR